jgi:hypothetical protein
MCALSGFSLAQNQTVGQVFKSLKTWVDEHGKQAHPFVARLRV